MAGKSVRVGGVVSNLGGLQQGDMLQDMEEAPGSLVAAKVDHLPLEVYLEGIISCEPCPVSNLKPELLLLS